MRLRKRPSAEARRAQGADLRYVRRALDLTQGRLAAAVGCSQMAIAQVEAGDAASLALRRRVALALFELAIQRHEAKHGPITLTAADFAEPKTRPLTKATMARTSLLQFHAALERGSALRTVIELITPALRAEGARRAAKRAGR
ncbi:MAG: helix-turn-helix domain-containing protein [Burkholderiales bacterium]